MKSNSTSISYLIWFALPVLAFLVIAVPLSMFFGPISGDLTRIGSWTERDFGWNKAQPSVFVRENGVSVSSPEVLVLGDSFSHPNMWQSYLAESRHLEILSFQYQDVGCVDNWLNWVGEKHYSTVHTVVIQIVERSFIPVFRSLNVCTNRTPEAFEIAKENITPVRPDFGLTLDATYLFPAAVNRFRMAWSDGQIVSGDVINAPLSTDELFSNRRSDRLLYYIDDENKFSWSEKDMASAVGNLKLIQKGLLDKGLNFIVVVVPDKSSAYRKYLAVEGGKGKLLSINKRVKAAGVNSVELLDLFQKEVAGTVDLYLPNDTHLSTQGYKLMADKISHALF